MDEKAKQDYLKILVLLRGSGTGLWTDTKYFEDKSLEENEARWLLYEMLVGEEELPREIRTALAELIAPKSKEYFVAPDRWLIFKKRSAGRVRNQMRETQLMHDVYQLVKSGETVEFALFEIAEEYNVSVDHLKVMWGTGGWRRTCEALWGEIPTRRKGAKRTDPD